MKIIGQKIFVTFLCVMLLSGKLAAEPSAVNKENSGEWIVESEDDGCSVEWGDDGVCKIVAPKGLTMWYKERLNDGCVIEYDALVTGNRISDLNCFWMATDPKAKDGSVFERMNERHGKFVEQYALKLYYVGFGGNYNTTTRFRRYDGNEAGISDESLRPEILKEYTDEKHLLRGNHWYHIVVSSNNGKVTCSVDGEKFVDWTDKNPLEGGWFGLRTTLSEVWMKNFKVKEYGALTLTNGKKTVPLMVLKGDRGVSGGVSFGVPFNKGELTLTKKTKTGWQIQSGDNLRDADVWQMARWDDGSVKWLGVSGIVGEDNGDYENQSHTTSEFLNEMREVMIMNGKRYEEKNVVVSVEREGNVCTVVKKEGEIGPHLFRTRMYLYKGSDKAKIVHTFIYAGDQNKDVISALGMECKVPLKEELYNRYVAFGSKSDGIWEEPVQPLTGRAFLSLGMDRNVEHLQKEGKMVPEHDKFDARGQSLLKDWASWDGYKLSQITDNAFYVRKRATADSPWIGTKTGVHSDGWVEVRDGERTFSLYLKDMWQSYPSGLEVENMRGDEAKVTVWFWSPDAEPMDLRHYDKVAHGLNASYEDVQDSLSTPYGVARTHTMWVSHHHAEEELVVMPTTAYLKEKNAFAMRNRVNSQRSTVNDDIFGAEESAEQKTMEKQIEKHLDYLVDLYRDEVAKEKWYGFWNYGDFMHSYDAVRESWQYDVGGYAWDNTELGTPMWLWYMFLRTGREDIFTMAEAMSRHNGEVDCYHIGGLAGLGSRHNVSHWGCGAKESRISQAAFNRFLYYLTADDRAGDLMSDVKDADQMLYDLDPMRLAEPRDKYPCSAPARLRIGPDWLAYVGNWMTEWERTGNEAYKQKIIAGMKSIAKLPDGLFTGNKALGFDPKTGELSYDGTPGRMNTNHLMTIMGGFEIMNELREMIEVPEFDAVWFDHAKRYKEMALRVSHNSFPVRRLEAYAAFADKENGNIDNLLRGLLDATKRQNPRDTNTAALWSLDAMYVLGALE